MTIKRTSIRFKPIENYDGYWISDLGDVYSTIGKGSRNKNKINSPYKLKSRPSKHGYERVCLRDSKTNKRKDVYVHRLVANAFIENPENKPCVNHKNCNTHNNYVENLEWATIKENTDYTLKVGNVVRDKKSGKYKSTNKRK